MRTRAGWLAALLLLVAALAPRPAAAQGNAEAAPLTCSIGVNVESLYDLDMARDTFGAVLWIWTVCPPAVPRQPLETIEFPTSAGGLARDAIEVTTLGDGRTYASQRVQGTFRQNWEMDAYPFDRQSVAIPIDEAEFGAETVLFAPDVAQSFMSREVAPSLDEWDVSPLAVSTRVTEEESAYGVPGAQNARYARAEARFTLERTKIVTFLKLTAGVYVAAFIGFISFFYDPNDRGTFGGKLGLLVGVLFAVLVNLRAADTTIGDTGHFTLVTQIHLVTLAFVVLLALSALIDRQRVEAGATLPHPHWRRLSLIGLAYVAIMAGLIARAALS